MNDYSSARHNMVESQIRTNKVTDDGLLSAFEATPREAFVPKALTGIAYVDEDLHIGDSRHLMEPMVLARLLQAAEPEASDLALVVGGATGYAAAILAGLVATVVSLDSDEALTKRANDTFMTLGIDNAAAVAGVMEDGYAAQAPYGLIVIDGGVEVVPDALIDQLSPGGRLVAVTYAEEGEPGRAMIVEKTAAGAAGRVLFDASVPLLPGFRRTAGFVF